MWRVYLMEFIIVFVVSLLWVRGIDKMITENPDYKGEDFLNEEDNEKENNNNK